MAEYQYFLNNLTDEDKVSVYILNYKRPHNLEKSLPLLETYKLIDEIIVSHGSPEGYTEFKGSKIKNIKDYDNNKKYGAGRRFLIDLNNFKNERIVVIDDDNIPTERLIMRMLMAYRKDPEQIYGPVKRNCNKDGYTFNPETGQSNTILTCLVLTSKSVIENFQKHFSEVESILSNFNGNGDDLTFNYIFTKYYKKEPIYIEGGYIELDTDRGYSQIPGHGTQRNKICRSLWSGIK